jgi:hypothetical protein
MQNGLTQAGFAVDTAYTGLDGKKPLRMITMPSFSSMPRVHLAKPRRKLADASGKEILATIRGKDYSLCVD